MGVAANNSGMLNYNGSQSYLAGFTAGVTAVFDQGDQQVVVTGTGAVVAGDTFKRANITVHDGYGNRRFGTFTSVNGSATVNLVPNTNGASGETGPTLNPARGLSIMATLVTRKGLIADGSVDIGGKADETAALSNWDRRLSAAEATDPAS